MPLLLLYRALSFWLLFFLSVQRTVQEPLDSTCVGVCNVIRKLHAATLLCAQLWTGFFEAYCIFGVCMYLYMYVSRIQKHCLCSTAMLIPLTKISRNLSSGGFFFLYTRKMLCLYTLLRPRPLVGFSVSQIIIISAKFLFTLLNEGQDLYS